MQLNRLPNLCLQARLLVVCRSIVNYAPANGNGNIYFRAPSNASSLLRFTLCRTFSMSRSWSGVHSLALPSELIHITTHNFDILPSCGDEPLVLRPHELSCGTKVYAIPRESHRDQWVIWKNIIVVRQAYVKVLASVELLAGTVYVYSPQKYKLLPRFNHGL